MRNSLSLLIVACFAACAASASAQMKAQGTDTPSYIQFSLPRFQVAVGETNAVVTLVRTGDSRVSAAVEFSTRENTAEDGVDFRACGGTVVFAAGQNFKTISIPILREGAPVAKSFAIDLEQAGPNTVVITPSAPIEIQPEPPALDVQLKSGTLHLSWPDTGLPFKLETQIDGEWVAVTSAPSLTDGAWHLKLSPGLPVVFFRLVRYE